jgi:hypothetical protein
MSGLVTGSRVHLLQKGARATKVSAVVMVILTAIKAVVGLLSGSIALMADMTMIGEEAIKYLTEYLEFRMRAGEKLSSRSSVLAPKYARKHFIATNNICDKIRKAIRTGGFPWRTYIFRSYFDTQLLTAEARRLIIRDFRVFFMGHAGDIERTYTLNKHKLPEDMIDEMREAYLRCQPLLQSYGEARRRDDLPALVRKQLLLAVGYNQEEVDAMKPDELSDEEMKQKLRERLFTTPEINVGRQQIIQELEPETHTSFTRLRSIGLGLVAQSMANTPMKGNSSNLNPLDSNPLGLTFKAPI